MHRRVFIDAVAASMVAVPLGAAAQNSVRVRRIATLTNDEPEAQATLDRRNAALSALGWVEGQNLRVERRSASGNLELLDRFADELARLNVEIIGTLGTPAALAAKNATKTIPIVIYSAADPVGSGLVASLAKPGGNVTGFSLLGPEIELKRVELLRELVPGLLRLGVLETANPYYRTRRNDFAQKCRSLGVQPMFFEVATQDDVASAIREMARRGAQALIIPQESLFFENPALVMSLASQYALPAVTSNGSIVEAGALAVLTTSLDEQNERFAWFVDKILRGAKPSELPIQQPTRFTLVVNLKAAKSLGLTIPRSVLLRADEVVN
jgi:putative ABC transport system substrate-binding protein